MKFNYGTITNSVLSIFFLALTVYCYIDYTETKKSEKAEKQSIAQSKTEQAALQVEQTLHGIKTVIDSVATILKDRSISESELNAVLQHTLTDNQHITSTFMAYEPFVFDSKTRLHSPLFMQRNGQTEFMMLHEAYDYTIKLDASQVWYHNIIEQGSMFTGPYYGEAIKSQNITYAMSVYDDNEELLGVLGADISLDHIYDIMQQMGLSRDGYGILFSKNGDIIYHPNKRYLRNLNNISDLTTSDSLIFEMADEAISQNTLVHFAQNDLTEHEAWMTINPVSGTNWLLAIVFMKESIPTNTDVHRQNLMHLGLTGAGFIFFLVLLVFQVSSFSSYNLWFSSITLAILLCLTVVWFWNAHLTHMYTNHDDFFTITDRYALANFINEMQTYTNPNQEKVIIPTGVYIQTLDFSDGFDVDITGFIWQHYPTEILNSIEPGFELPEATNLSLDQHKPIVNNENTTYRWYFEATLRQIFNYSNYPLDSKNIWLRIVPQDYSREMFLTPDLNSYHSILPPNDLPGIDTRLVLPGWSLQKSYFSYLPHVYKTNFGMHHDETIDENAELYFTIEIRRAFLSSFISNLLPFFVFSVLLFGVLITTSTIPEKSKLFDYSINRVFVFCSGLIFSVILMHNHVRSTIDYDHLLYIEYFYLILYAFIMLVCINAFMVSLKPDWNFTGYKDNLIPKVLYWPVLLGFMLVITWVFFY